MREPKMMKYTRKIKKNLKAAFEQPMLMSPTEEAEWRAELEASYNELLKIPRRCGG
jgi:hypothetical protein